MSKRYSNRKRNQRFVDWKQRPYVYDGKPLLDSIQPIELSRWGKIKDFWEYYSCYIMCCICTIVYIAGIIWGFTIK